MGGRLRPRLEALGYPVRSLCRRPEFLRGSVNAQSETVRGDIRDADAVRRLVRGADVAFYLVHSMGSGGTFESEDRNAAEQFARICHEEKVGRIVYLGGLGETGRALSPHLRSRHEVGDVLRALHPAVLELRASIIIGAGSLSFELVRALVQRLPVMILPKWTSNLAQPIAIDDVLELLLRSITIDLERLPSRTVEIGGPDRVTYADLLRYYARIRGLERWMIPVPVLTPWLSSLWLGLITPVYARIGRALVESLVHPTVVNDARGLEAMGVTCQNVEASIRKALEDEDAETSGTRWFDALSAGAGVPTWAGVRFGERLVDVQTRWVPRSAEEAFAPLTRMGGESGFFYGDVLWWIRGWIDLLVGGVGVWRRRPEGAPLRCGDVVGCFRVEELEPGRRLRLVAEMKLPGRAWLEFQVDPMDRGSLIHQTAIFDPIGLSGLAYWHGIYPVHALMFDGMIDGVARASAPEIAGRSLTAGRSRAVLLGMLALCLSVAALGGAATAPAIPTWYATLPKPWFTPPAWVFGPVWTALYAMMAVSLWTLWRQVPFRVARLPYALFAVQLAANLAWSFLFFAFRSPMLALADIVVLDVAVLLTMLAFARYSLTAFALLVPYFVWILFATLLNVGFVVLLGT